MRSIAIACLFILAASAAPAAVATKPVATSAIQQRADRFLELVNAGYQSLSRVSQEAQWTADTDVSSEHDAAAEAANKAYAAFNGNPALITEGRALLKHRAELKPITVRQLEHVLLN